MGESNLKPTKFHRSGTVVPGEWFLKKIHMNILDIARPWPCRGGSFEKDRRSTAFRNVRETQKQWMIGICEMPMKWNKVIDMRESGHEWVSGWMNHWIKRWINDNQCMDVSQWANDSVNQQVGVSVWVKTWMNERIINEWTNECMNELTSSLTYPFPALSHLFTEQLLNWTTWSLRWLFSHLLLWAASYLGYLPLSAIFFLWATTSPAFVSQFFSSHSHSNLFNFQLQPQSARGDTLPNTIRV